MVDVFFELFSVKMPLIEKEPVPDRDLVLLRRVSQGDEGAFNELYHLTYGKVYAYLYRLLRGKEMVEDVLIETYSEVWRGAKRFRGDSKVTTWIFGIARNLALNELRKIQHHEDVEDQLELSNGREPLEGPFDQKRLLRKAMGALSIKQREVLDLVFFQEMTYEEVSEILHIPVNTVKTRVFYAKELLRAVLKTMGVDRNVL